MSDRGAVLAAPRGRPANSVFEGMEARWAGVYHVLRIGCVAKRRPLPQLPPPPPAGAPLLLPLRGCPRKREMDRSLLQSAVVRVLRMETTISGTGVVAVGLTSGQSGQRLSSLATGKKSGPLLGKYPN